MTNQSVQKGFGHENQLYENDFGRNKHKKILKY